MLKRPTRFAILALTILPSLLLGAAAPHFVESGDFDALSLLPPPPAAGSTETKGELETIFQLQQTRTAADVARAKSEAKLTPVAFSSVMGDGFTAENLPKLFSLLADATAESKRLSDGVKTQYDRQRPQFVDPRITPAIEGETDASYPSGHSTRAMLWAEIFMDLAPGKKGELVARGQEIGWDRVLAGVHFPSDIYAGRVLGQNLALAMKKNADFQRRFAEAKGEYDAFAAIHQTAAREPVSVP